MMAEATNPDKRKNLPSRGARVNYKALNEGVGYGMEASIQSPVHKSQGQLDDFPGVSTRQAFGDADLTLPVGSRETEDDFDEIQRMRQEFEALEREEEDLRRQRLVVEERRKLESKREVVAKLRGEVSSFGSPGGIDNKVRYSKPAVISKDLPDSLKNVTLNDLRSDVSLRSKVKSQIKKDGLELFLFSDSESESESGTDSDSKSIDKSKKLGNKFASDSESDSTDRESQKKKRKSKSKRKSGISARARDRVVNMQRYPQSQLRFEFVQEAVSFEKLDMNLFIAGELEIISSSSTGKAERSGRIELLKRLMYLNASYEFAVIRSLYAAVLREIELGHLHWGESFLYVENAVLVGKKKFSSSVKRGKFSKDKSQIDAEEKLWFCSQFQRNKCSHKSPHTLVVKGVMRLAHHICASCWLKDKLKLEHPECSSSCPHSRD